jgi:hypothetical protein
LLLQKSDGTFELIVWGEQVLGSNSVTLQLGSTFATVKVYDITVGTVPQQTFTRVKTVPLSVSDHALIIEASGPMSSK